MTARRRCPTCEQELVRPPQSDVWASVVVWGANSTAAWAIVFWLLFNPPAGPPFFTLAFVGFVVMVAWLFYSDLRRVAKGRARFDRVRDRLEVVE